MQFNDLLAPSVRTVTIANGQTTSDALDCINGTVVGILTPAALTGTAFTFSVSADGVTYNTLYSDAGTAVSVTVAASRYIYLDPTVFAGVRYVKVISGSAEGAQRIITLVLRPV
jgi:hypothetical protein